MTNTAHDRMRGERRRYWLTFNAEQTRQPLIWEMSRKFHLSFNIRNSSVTQGLGLTAVELEGPGPAIEQAVRWFTRKGIRVDPLELNAMEG